MFADVYVRPYVGAIGPDFILTDDNARPPKAWVTNEYLQTATIENDLANNVPGLKPIEHALDMLQTAMSARPVQPTTVQELQQALLSECA